MKVSPERVGLSGARLVKVDLLTQQYIDEGKLPGTVTMVARRGELAHFECHGKMDIEADKDVHEDTIFRIYSMSKPITTVGAMMLYEQGLFELNDPVSKYIPELKGLKVLV